MSDMLESPPEAHPANGCFWLGILVLVFLCGVATAILAATNSRQREAEGSRVLLRRHLNKKDSKGRVGVRIYVAVPYFETLSVYS